MKKLKPAHLLVILAAVLVLAGCKKKDDNQNNQNQGQTNQPQVPFNPNDLDTPPNQANGNNSNNNSPNNNSGNNNQEPEVKQVSNIPVYPGASLKSYTEEDNNQGASYTTPKGVSAKDVFDYYAKEMPAIGWNKKEQDADKSVIYKNAQGQEAEIWIYYDNAEEGTDYVIESPPFTGHPAPIN